MIEIKLTQDKIALVDDEDYEWLINFTWCADRVRNYFYATTSIKRKKVRMHRLILN